MGAPLNPAREARRKAELRQRLGNEQPRCFYCGCPELPLLRALLEEHHVNGRNHDPALTVYACRNCHAIFHEKAIAAGINLEPQPDPVKRVASILRSEAVHHDMLAEAKRRQAALLEGVGN